MAIELKISDLRNLDEADSSLLFAVDGDTETFSLSVNTLFEYTKQRLGYLETGGVEMYLGEVIPPTHTELDGKQFDPLAYPKMGALFPSGKLPDTRGMILKHAPSGRMVLSFEAEAVKSHDHTATSSTNRHNHTGTANHGGAHFHTVLGQNRFIGDVNADGPFDASSQVTTIDDGAWAAMDNSGAHSHSLSIDYDSHNHAITVDASGSAKNLVDNIAVKFIIKKA